MKAFAIKNPGGQLVIDTISYSKTLSKENIIDYHQKLSRYRISYTWAGLYKGGYRCVPVEIREIKKSKHEQR